SATVAGYHPSVPLVLLGVLPPRQDVLWPWLSSPCFGFPYCGTQQSYRTAASLVSVAVPDTRCPAATVPHSTTGCGNQSGNKAGATFLRGLLFLVPASGCS